MPQYFQTFIFDLDGTLLNTLADLAGACNSLLTAHGWPEHPVDAYRLMVGNGFRLLVSRCLPSSVRENLTDEDLSALVDEGNSETEDVSLASSQINRTPRPACS